MIFRIVVGTDAGKIMLFEGQEQKRDFYVFPPGTADSSSNGQTR